MAPISTEKIDDIRRRVDIERLIGKTVALRRVGRRLVGRCPFHEERTPSFSVDPEKKLFHCFGCGVGGDAFHFVMRAESVEFVEAVRILAHETGVELDVTPESAAEKQAKTLRAKLVMLHERAQALYEQQLWADADALRYLRSERGLADETIRAWHLGFAPNAWTRIADALSPEFDAEFLVMAGLVTPRSDGRKIVDRLRARIVIPIVLPDGTVAGFGGRRCEWLAAEDAAAPKYLNSPQSPIYDKSGILFGLDKAKFPLKRQKKAVLVEGYFDAILLHQAGIETAVATCGTALSTKHAELLVRWAEDVTVFYDGDTAGIAAAAKAAKTLLAAGLSVRLLTLADDEDPDTHVRRVGARSLEQELQDAPSAIDALLASSMRRHKDGGMEGLVRVVEEIRPFVLAVGDRLKRDILVEAVARRLQIDPSVLLRHTQSPTTPIVPQVAKSPAQALEATAGTRFDSSQRTPRLPKIELAVLRMFLENPEEVVRRINERNAREAFSHPLVARVIARGFDAAGGAMRFDGAAVLRMAEDAGASEDEVTELRKALVEAVPNEDNLDEALDHLLRRDYERKLRELRGQIALEGDAEALERLNVRALELVKAKAALG